ncbi:uncharacterized protein SOCE26_082600 [Sorangium cellulosum]|uniref:Uncharacterized protein n=1 Tax=Sorangium cellulosum TaxID=56 RepID=A0A2L0F5I3_SORCE|nr:uncharacterized protein SOCE26_082600 [Sorangium cellulosum]
MLKHLMIEEMVALVSPWVENTQRKRLFLSIPEIAGLHPKAVAAHEAVLAVRPSKAGPSGKMNALNDELARVDERHDHLAKAVCWGIDAHRRALPRRGPAGQGARRDLRPGAAEAVSGRAQHHQGVADRGGGQHGADRPAPRRGAVDRRVPEGDPGARENDAAPHGAAVDQGGQGARGDRAPARRARRQGEGGAGDPGDDRRRARPVVPGRLRGALQPGALRRPRRGGRDDPRARAEGLAAGRKAVWRGLDRRGAERGGAGGAGGASGGRGRGGRGNGRRGRRSRGLSRPQPAPRELSRRRACSRTCCPPRA